MVLLEPPALLGLLEPLDQQDQLGLPDRLDQQGLSLQHMDMYIIPELKPLLPEEILLLAQMDLYLEELLMDL